MAKLLSLYAGRIVQDPEIMVGKPVIKGTRISAERVVSHLTHNHDLNDLFDAYPRLTIEDVEAALAYACDQDAIGSPTIAELRSF